MDINLLFSATNLETETSNTIATFGLWVMGFIIFGVLFWVAWKAVPFIISERKADREEEAEFEKKIWFDTHKSILHKGSRQLKIPEGSLEHYVCKFVFKNPKVYQNDWDILEAAREVDKGDRALYFAVDRINKKASKAFNLDSKLLKHSKEKTRLNDTYF